MTPGYPQLSVQSQSLRAVAELISIPAPCAPHTHSASAPSPEVTSDIPKALGSEALTDPSVTAQWPQLKVFNKHPRGAVSTAERFALRECPNKLLWGCSQWSHPRSVWQLINTFAMITRGWGHSRVSTQKQGFHKCQSYFCALWLLLKGDFLFKKKKSLWATGPAENQPCDPGKTQKYLLTSSNSQNVYKFLLKTANYSRQLTPIITEYSIKYYCITYSRGCLPTQHWKIQPIS